MKSKSNDLLDKGTVTFKVSGKDLLTDINEAPGEEHETHHTVTAKALAVMSAALLTAISGNKRFLGV